MSGQADKAEVGETVDDAPVWAVVMMADIRFIREAFEELQPIIQAYVPEPGTPAGWALKRKLDKLARNKEAPHD